MTSQNRKRGVLINEMRAQGIRRLKLTPEHLWRRMDWNGLGYVRKFDIGRTIVRVTNDAGDHEFLQMTKQRTTNQG